MNALSIFKFREGGYSWNSVSNRCELFPQPGDAVGNDDYVSGVIDGDPSLTIIYANAATWKVPWMADAPNIRCGEWGCRSKRFVQQIKASGMVPDIIFLTEVNLYSWGIVQGSREPYQALKLLHDELRLQLNIEYRIASANGVEAEIGLDRNGGVINQGEAVLYNPLRIVNKTMKNVPYITNSFVRGIGHRVPHDEATSYFMEAGAHLRASVPFCTSSFFELRRSVPRRPIVYARGHPPNEPLRSIIWTQCWTLMELSVLLCAWVKMEADRAKGAPWAC